MTLQEICSQFDIYEIVDTLAELEDRDYYTSYDKIFIDGAYDISPNKEGFIHIHNVKDASYIIIIDKYKKTYIRVYKYIAESKFKPTYDACKLLRDILNNEEYIEKKENNDILKTSDIIDINNFRCTECGNNEFIFFRSSRTVDALETKCSRCKTEYELMPSKYYKISSKRVIYFKSEDVSRDVDIRNRNER